MFFRALLTSVVLISTAHAAPIHDGIDDVFYEEKTRESTNIFREALKLPFGTTRSEVIATIDEISRNELRAEGVVISKRSLALRSVLKRAGLLCGVSVSATEAAVRNCLKDLYGSVNSDKAAAVNSGALLELMYVLSDALGRPVNDFYDWGAPELNNMLSALPDTPLE